MRSSKTPSIRKWTRWAKTNLSKFQMGIPVNLIGIFLFLDMAGYSGTPLLKKLGIKPDFKIILQNEPRQYLDWLNPLPEDVTIIKKSTKDDIDFVHIFVLQRKVFEKEFKAFKKNLKKDGMMWVSWPKKSSKVPTDLDENIIREFGLSNGLVDVKVCAVDDVWSGLKFVYRTKDR